MTEHHSERYEYWKCDSCGLEFESKEQAQKHEREYA